MRKLMLAAVVGGALLSASAAQATQKAVKVECWGDSICKNITLADACTSQYLGGNLTGIAFFSCSQYGGLYSGGSNCGGAYCESMTWDSYGSNRIGDLCKDTGGFDAFIVCSFSN